MLAAVLRHEWRSLVVDRSLFAITALLAITIGYGVWNGAQWTRLQQRTRDAAQAEQRARLQELRTTLREIESGRREPQGFLDPRSAASIGATTGAPYIVLPPAPLAALSIGQSDLYPYYFRVSLKSKQAIFGSDELENPSNLLSGRFDLAFVIVYLYPLLILALSYNLLSAEKEQGTLALALSQPVSLRSLTTGKLLVRGSVLLALTVGFALLATLIGGVDLSAPGALASLALWTAVVAAYGAFWFVLAIGVNAFGRGSATNALALAGLWLFFVLLVPSALNVAATSLYPVPSRVEMIQATRVAGKEAQAKGSQLLARFYEDHPDLAPADRSRPDFSSTSYTVQQEVDRLVQPVVRQFDRQVEQQQALVDRFRFLSPAILAQGALNDLSGTGAARYRHFNGLVDEYLTTWQGYFLPRIFQRVKLGASELGALPRFTYVEEPWANVAGRVAAAVVGLLVPAVVLLVLALAALRRYPVVG